MSDNQRYQSPTENAQQNNEPRRQYPMQQEGQYYHYQPQDFQQPPQNPKRGKGLIVFAVFLLVLFIGSMVGIFVLFSQNARRMNQEVERRRSQAARWTDTTTTLAEAPADSDAGAALRDAEEETAETKADLRQKNFSLEEATRESNVEDALSIKEIAKIGKEAVVAISTEVGVMDIFGGARTLSFAGSGSIISEDGYILTNNHVIQNAQRIMVQLDNDEVYIAEPVGADQLTDLAVIKIDAKDGETFPTVALGDSDTLEVGELAVAIGNPTGELPGTVTSGIISALNREIHISGVDFTMIQTSASINSGNSGGALFNSFAEVIGVITAKVSGAQGQSFEGLGFAIPINSVKPVVEDLIRYGYVRGRVTIGVYPETFDKQLAQYYRIADRGGVFVRKVEPQSAADKAGIREGDLIVEFNGKRIETVDELNNAKRELKPGDVVEVALYRSGEEMTVEIELQETRPE